MIWKDGVRLLVIKTNRYWPFSFLHRLPYYLAIKVFILVFRRFQEIESIYMRHGLIKSKWIPAISDIDLTVIIDGKLELDNEYHFLRMFWKRFVRLKRLFPMLGEIDILNSEHIESWTRFTIRGYEASGWKLIHGAPTARSNYIAEPQRISIDTLNDSLTTYHEYFLEKFYDQNLPHDLVLNELARLAFKIQKRQKTSEEPSAGKTSRSDHVASKAEMLWSVKRVLEEEAKNLNLTTDDHYTSDEAAWLDWVSIGDTVSQQKVSYHFDICRGAIESVVLSSENDFIILGDALDASDVVDCIAKIRSMLIRRRRIPIILGPNTFKYIMWFYNPFMYTGLTIKRSVPFGTDPLLDMKKPHKYFFVKALLEQTINVLTFPQRLTTIFPPDQNWLLEKSTQNMLERSIQIKLYLEKGIFKSQYDEYLREYKEHYPHYYEVICELSISPNHLTIRSQNKRWYSLFRSLADDIHDAISRSDILDSFFAGSQTRISDSAGATDFSKVDPIGEDNWADFPQSSIDTQEA